MIFANPLTVERGMNLENDYIFSVRLERNLNGIISSIQKDVIASNSDWAKKHAEDSLIGWRATHYTCKGPVSSK